MFIAVILWFVFCLIVGGIGSTREIGFGKAFWLSFFLSPVVGGIVTFMSKELDVKEEVETQNEIVDGEKIKPSIVDELTKISEMKDKGDLTEEEFKKAKDVILSR